MCVREREIEKGTQFDDKQKFVRLFKKGWLCVEM